MNRTQAKARFTELTGLPAKKRYVSTGIWKLKGYANWHRSFALGYSKGDKTVLDSRTELYWVALVSFLEELKEVA